MFKKFSLFLLLIMIGFVLVACGNGEETAGDQQEETTTDEENTEEESTNEESGSDYPSKPIQIIVPYSAGGGGDTVARILAEPLSEKLGVQVNVVNRDGAGGEIGISEMANAEADGYTLGVFGYPDNVVLENTVNTDFTFDSFKYLAAFDDVPHALFVGPDSEFENLEDFVSYAKDHPGELTVGESGALGLLMVLAFNDIAGIETTPVAYEGGGDLINALLGGHVNGASSSITAEQELNPQGGKALAYAAEERIEMFSDTPTFSEQGFDLQLGVSRVLVAPEGVPDEVVKVLTEALNELGQGDEIKQKFDEVGTPYRYLNHEDVTEYLKKSNETILPIIEKNADDF